MSLFSVIGKIAAPLAKAGVIRGTVGKILGGQKSPIIQPIAKKGLPAVRRTLPGIGGKVLRGAGGVAAGAVGGAALQRLGQPAKKKRRRMNPCNDKALRRALRRIEAYDRQRKRVDKALRKACPPTRRRTVRTPPSGAHRH